MLKHLKFKKFFKKNLKKLYILAHPTIKTKVRCLIKNYIETKVIEAKKTENLTAFQKQN